MATEVELRDGTRALTWALLPSDRAAIAEAWDRLDPETQFQRFLAATPHLSEAMLDHLVDEVDGVNHIARVLFVLDEEMTGEPAAVARMVRYPDDPTTVDVAVTVGREHRGRGVASALLEELVRDRPPEVNRILTRVAGDNPASVALLRRLGETRVVQEDGVVEVEVLLPPVPEETGQ